MPDPLTANEELQRASIRHQMRTERVKNEQGVRVRNFLRQKLFPDLSAKLESRLEGIRARGFDAAPQRTQRVRDLYEATDELITNSFADLYGVVRDGMFEVSAAEGAWQSGALRQVLPLAVEVVLPSREILRSVVTSRPFQGRILRNWYGGLSRTLKDRVRSSVAVGIAEGEGTAVIGRRFRQQLDLTARQAEGIARTATNHVTAQARQESYKANDDIVKGWIFSATLDGSTTLECAGLDGSRYPLNEGPIPPRHFACRSADIPWLKSFKELGFEVGDLPPGTRRKFDGKVPGDFKFGDFLKAESPEFQREYLGPTRFELFKTGKITIDKFTDSLGNTLTIPQLRRLESGAFRAAKGLSVSSR